MRRFKLIHIAFSSLITSVGHKSTTQHAFLIYGPSIIAFDKWTGRSIVEENDCDVEFAKSFLFTFITALLEFCIPFLLVVSFNIAIYWNIRSRTRQIHSGPQEAKRIQGVTSEMITCRLSRDRKASRSLTLLTTLFLVCWTPYTITTIIFGVCGDSCVNEDMYEAFVWLLWLNSTLNPFLYAYTNSQFASHYKKLLCGCIYWGSFRQRPNVVRIKVLSSNIAIT